MADRLGFVGGSAWTEGNVGTNAIGTALVLGEAVQIRGAEHFVESHTHLGLRGGPAASTRGPARTLGVVDVSGPVPGAAPGRAGAGPARRPAEPRWRRWPSTAQTLDRLRSRGRAAGRAADRARHSSSTRRATPRRPPASQPARPGRRSPSGLEVGEIWCPRLGAATAEALPGRLAAPARRAARPAPSTARARPDRRRPEVRVTGERRLDASSSPRGTPS